MLAFSTYWRPWWQSVTSSLSAGAGLNDLNRASVLIDESNHETGRAHLATAVRVLAEVQQLSTLPDEDRLPRLQAL